MNHLTLALKIDFDRGHAIKALADARRDQYMGIPATNRKYLNRFNFFYDTTFGENNNMRRLTLYQYNKHYQN